MVQSLEQLTMARRASSPNGPGGGRARGFTLIELMITVAIVAILAALAYPSYTRYMLRAHRASAVSYVMGVASKQVQFNLDARRYGNDTELGTTLPAEVFPYYTVVTTPDNLAIPPTYKIIATPKIGSPQTADTPCGTLTVDQTGNKTITGTADVATCW